MKDPGPLLLARLAVLLALSAIVPCLARSLSAALPSFDTRALLSPWQPGGLYEERSRTGPLYLSVARDVGGPFPAVEGYWSRDWIGGQNTIETRGGKPTERWLGYRLPGDKVSGDFDLEVEIRRPGRTRRSADASHQPPEPRRV